jgi:hypothetical protein
VKCHDQVTYMLFQTPTAFMNIICIDMSVLHAMHEARQFGNGPSIRSHYIRLGRIVTPAHHQRGTSKFLVQSEKTLSDTWLASPDYEKDRSDLFGLAVRSCCIITTNPHSKLAAAAWF